MFFPQSAVFARVLLPVVFPVTLKKFLMGEMHRNQITLFIKNRILVGKAVSGLGGQKWATRWGPLWTPMRQRPRVVVPFMFFFLNPFCGHCHPTGGYGDHWYVVCQGNLATRFFPPPIQPPQISRCKIHPKISRNVCPQEDLFSILPYWWIL